MDYLMQGGGMGVGQRGMTVGAMAHPGPVMLGTGIPLLTRRRNRPSQTGRGTEERAMRNDDGRTSRQNGARAMVLASWDSKLWIAREWGLVRGRVVQEGGEGAILPRSRTQKRGLQGKSCKSQNLQLISKHIAPGTLNTDRAARGRKIRRRSEGLLKPHILKTPCPEIQDGETDRAGSAFTSHVRARIDRE